jgi:hypothetical protein
MLIIPALRRLKQEDFEFPVRMMVCTSKFQDSLG